MVSGMREPSEETSDSRIRFTNISTRRSGPSASSRSYTTITLRISAYICLLFCLRVAQAGPSMESSLDALSTVRQFRDVAVSEDGHMAAWIESGQRNAASDSRGAAVYVKDLRDAAAAPRRVGEPAENIQGLSWSLDGKLAFLSDADGPGQLELYVAERPGHSKPRKVTDVTGFLEGPQWSPDGKSIALLRIEGITRVPGPTEATAPDSGVVRRESSPSSGWRL